MDSLPILDLAPFVIDPPAEAADLFVESTPESDRLAITQI